MTLDLTPSIQARDQQLSNEQLLDLYNHEIATLTPAARGLLIEEIKKRNLDTELWQNSRPYTPQASVSEVEQVKKWLMFFESGWSRGTIKAYEMLNGLSAEESTLLLERIPSYLKKRSNAATSMITNGVLFIVMGASIRVLPLNPDQHKAIILMCYIFMFYGTLRLLHGWYTKRRTKRLLEKWILSPDDFDGSAVPTGEKPSGI